MNTMATHSISNKPGIRGFSDKLRELDACYAGFVSHCDARTLDLLEQTDRVQFPAGTVMFRESDACQNFLRVLEGSVRVCKHCRWARGHPVSC